MLPHEIQQFATSSSDIFHSDTIHHVEFDFYGQRVVTVSSDKMVCIWDRDSQGIWRKSASWKKHGGAIWKARFSHPEYGQVLATCSFDNTIQIFDKDAADGLDTRPVGSSDSSNGWVCRVVLRQSTSSITDIQFAPHYLGLQLAACTSSGRIIIYEAEDIMALDNWNVLFDEMVASNRLSSLSWSTNRFDPPYLVVSSDDVDAPASDKLFIFRFNANTGLIRSDLEISVEGAGPKDKEHRYFHFEDQVSMVLFGPSCGLSTHKLAVAVGAKIIVYQMMTTGRGDGAGNNGSASGGENGRQQNEQDQQQGEFVLKGSEVLEEGSSQVVRFSFNLLGDTISAVYADGLVRIWRYVFANRWAPISTITPPAENERSAKDDVYY